MTTTTASTMLPLHQMTREEKLRALDELLLDLNAAETIKDLADELTSLDDEASLESIKHGIKDMEEGRVIPAEEAFAKLRAL